MKQEEKLKKSKRDNIMKDFGCNTDDINLDEVEKNIPININRFRQKELLLNIIQKNKEEYEKYYNKFQEIGSYSFLMDTYRFQKFVTLDSILQENNKWINYNIELFRIAVLTIQEEISYIKYCYEENDSVYEDTTINIGNKDFYSFIYPIVFDLYKTIINIIGGFRFHKIDCKEEYKLPKEVFTDDANTNKVLSNLESLLINIIDNIYYTVKCADDNFKELVEYIKGKFETEKEFNIYFEILNNMRDTYYRTLRSIVNNLYIYLCETL